MLNSIDAKADYIKNLTLELGQGDDEFVIEQISILADEIREVVDKIQAMKGSL